MASSLALIIVVGLIADALFRRARLPGLVGMLLAGVLLGPYALDLLAPEMLAISSDLRSVALIVILLRAGFELNRSTLHRVGKTALVMSCVPALLEIAAVIVLAPPLLGLSWQEAAILGAILGAVSPAVVVPLMIGFLERGKGADKGIPTLVLAASAVDDVFVIVLFSILLGIAGGGSVAFFAQLAGIPVAIVLGAVSGLVPGYVLVKLFQRYDLKPPRRTLIILGVAIGMTQLEHALANVIPVASLIGVMAMAFIILEKQESIAHIISQKIKKLWVFAELLLFVLVGAQVNIEVAWHAGLAGALVIAGGLVLRSLGTWLSLLGSKLNGPEKLFAVVAYIPKATVQAAIGAVPLSLGLPGGEVILAVAVLSILLTAPTGAIAIEILGERILTEDIRPPYRFQELRLQLGLPRVGERLRQRSDNTVWKVIEERELWHPEAEPDSPSQPAIEIRLWEAKEDGQKGKGRTRRIFFTPDDPPLERHWEVLYGRTGS